uniref:Major facilitator superfamily associated domain-containing protein n=1 Tax=Chromera velia CCMP2878 TaxID=1169474 RepID=A0A0G4HA24_9ALVE|eukprot:Cvel_25608.t1-p1 / transcript=Cvel_25608.t1 / gene=Cvel_25608 / organism=Chromera_velia_CCMP2878 / gene_product=Maltose permease, putative / transcript_product=Maltose permease, putative / location=Cvel_scaffold2924:4661-9264(-) / protein_length=700 / sequence_SO=supercontig / SO=protein_coding / is_pseudo=false
MFGLTEGRIEYPHLKWLYFIQFVYLASSGRFMTVYFFDQGLKSHEIGMIFFGNKIATMVGLPLWTYMADISRRDRAIMIWTLIPAILLFPLMALEVSFVSRFYWLILIQLVQSFVGSGAQSIFDTLVLKELGEHKAKWGKQRLWGAVSWGIANTIFGWQIDAKGYSFLFLCNLSTGLLFVLSLSVLIRGGPSNSSGSSGVGKDVVLGDHGGRGREGERTKGRVPRDLSPDPSLALEREGERERELEQLKQPVGARDVKVKGSHMQTRRESRGSSLPVPVSMPSFSKYKDGTYPREEEEEEIPDERGEKELTAGAGVCLTGGHEKPAEELGVKEEEGQSQRSTNYLDALRSLCSSRRVAIFFFNIAIIGAGFGLIGNLLFVTLKKMGASAFLCGLSVSITVIFEVPIMYVSDWMLKHWGVGVMILLGEAAQVLRYFLYTLMPSPEWVLPIEPLHGVTYGLVWCAAVHFCSTPAVSRHGLEASAQGLLSLLHFKLAPMFATLAGGFVMESAGDTVLYGTCGALVLLSLFLYFWSEAVSKGLCTDDSDASGGSSHDLRGVPQRLPTSETEVIQREMGSQPKRGMRVDRGSVPKAEGDSESDAEVGEVKVGAEGGEAGDQRDSQAGRTTPAASLSAQAVVIGRSVKPTGQPNVHSHPRTIADAEHHNQSGLLTLNFESDSSPIENTDPEAAPLSETSAADSTPG